MYHNKSEDKGISKRQIKKIDNNFHPMTSKTNNDNLTNKKGGQDSQNEVYKPSGQPVVHTQVLTK